MSKKIIILFISFSFFLLGQSSYQQNIITVVATTNVHGEIDPCGWKKKPLGGLARKATIIDQLNEQGKNLLILDAGDLFFKKNIVDSGISMETAKVNAEVIMKSFNKMGCDAFSPGSKDFASGLDYLMELERKSSFPYISSNLVDDKNNLLFDSHIIKKINGKRIGIIGLSSNFENKVEGLNILNPISSLNYIISEIESKTDIIILLFNGSNEDIKEIYSNNFPIDLIIRSRATTRSNDGGNKIPTYVAGDRGKYLYQFDMNLVDESYPFIDTEWCNNTINRMEARLNKMKKGDLNIDLNNLYKDDLSTLNRIKNYETQIENANQRLENAVNIISFKKIELGKTVFDRPDILKIVDAGKLKIKDLVGPELPPAPDHKGRLPGDPHYNHSH